MLDYWASFARDGVPSAAGQPAWPAYGTERAYMAFEDAPRPKKHLLPGMYEFNEQVVCRRRARAASRGTGTSASPRRRCPPRRRMQMIDGAMQAFALTLDKFLEHAAKWHPRAEVVTGREGGARRSRRLCGARSAQPQGVGGAARVSACARGDRVATLAWNTQAHLEVWYAIMGMGAVCHTLNPRLTCRQLAAMVAQSERARADRQRRLAAAGAADRRGRAVDRAPGADRSTDRWIADGTAGGPLVLRARAADRAGARRRDLGRLRRDRALRPVLHLGHHRRAQGRHVHASRRATCTRCACCRRT